MKLNPLSWFSNDKYWNRFEANNRIGMRINDKGRKELSDTIERASFYIGTNLDVEGGYESSWNDRHCLNPAILQTTVRADDIQYIFNLSIYDDEFLKKKGDSMKDVYIQDLIHKLLIHKTDENFGHIVFNHTATFKSDNFMKFNAGDEIRYIIKHGTVYYGGFHRGYRNSSKPQEVGTKIDMFPKEAEKIWPIVSTIFEIMPKLQEPFRELSYYKNEFKEFAN